VRLQLDTQAALARLHNLTGDSHAARRHRHKARKIVSDIEGSLAASNLKSGQLEQPATG
jgi:hypothetical protein